MTPARERVRLAAVGDIHYTRASQGTLQSLCAYVAENADIVLLCGDIIDYGLPEEALSFAQEFTTAVKLPILAVLGNHEYESGKHDEVRRIFSDAGIIVLDSDACEVRGIGFVGVKGFAGGFGQHALQPWGEEMVKRFVHESVNETLKLESALASCAPRNAWRCCTTPDRRDGGQRAARDLGVPRLQSPRGTAKPLRGLGRIPRPRPSRPPEGRTQANIPVYNVALPLLKNEYPDRPPVHLYEVPIAVPAIKPDPIIDTPITKRS